MLLTAGSSFARFRIVEPLGKGGMAVVYKAYELQLERHVALKVLPAALLHEERFAERFEREARIVAQLEHPHIVPIYSFGIDDEVPWMSMRLLGGGTLADKLHGRRFSVGAVISILEPVAAALDYAHSRQVVHRDVKPSNILCDAFDHHYLTDFGIARMADATTQLTVSGVRSGTPLYMSPEQATSGKVDGRCDIYSLGIVAYEMLAGRVPFRGETPITVLMRQVHDPVPTVDSTIISAPVFKVLARCLAKSPGDRFPTATAFVRALGHPTAVRDGITGADAATTTQRTVTIVEKVGKVAAPTTGPRVRRRYMFAISTTISLFTLLAFGLIIAQRRAQPPVTAERSEPALPAAVDEREAQIRQKQLPPVPSQPTPLGSSSAAMAGRAEAPAMPPSGTRPPRQQPGVPPEAHQADAPPPTPAAVPPQPKERSPSPIAAAAPQAASVTGSASAISPTSVPSASSFLIFNATVKYTRYRDPLGRFEIEQPNGWEFVPPGGSAIAIFARKDRGASIVIDLANRTDPLTPDEIAANAQTEISTLKQQQPNAKDFSFELFNSKGGPGALIRYSRPGAKGSERVLRYLISVNRDFYRLDAIVQVASIVKSEPILVHMIQSFMAPAAPVDSKN